MNTNHFSPLPATLQFGKSMRRYSKAYLLWSGKANISNRYSNVLYRIGVLEKIVKTQGKRLCRSPVSVTL